MKATTVFDRVLGQAVLALAASCLLVLGAHAQAPAPAPAQPAKAKPPLRLPPNPAQSSRIPAGVDTGSPATSDALPLGTPVTGAADAGTLRTGNAAARAAARPDPRTRTGAPLRGPEPVVTEVIQGDAARPATRSPAEDCAVNATRTYNTAMSTCTALAARGARAECATRAAEARRTSCGG